MASNQQKNQTDNKQHTVEARDAIFIKIIPVFLPPKPDHKCSHTNSHIYAVTAITQDHHRSQLELGPPVSGDLGKVLVAVRRWDH